MSTEMMKDVHDTYQSPLGRYASPEMQYIFSENNKFRTWRKLWVALVEAEREMGLKITEEQIAELKAHMNDINYDVAKVREKEVRHDVMAHVYAYGQQCPKAAGIIHLGATSCYVTDNTDILNLRVALKLVKQKTLGVMKLLADFAYEYRAMPILGSTHGQSAAVVTVGKRATLWLQDFQIALDEVLHVEEKLPLLGCRGATGTADTFVELFNGDTQKAWQLESKIIKALEGKEDEVFPVSGQTYPRIIDKRVMNALEMVAIAAHKMGTDIRLLQRSKEMEEPFEKNQIGSSAMAYKRNPMRSERICSLARDVFTESINASMTASIQWLERTLDDSANRRLCLPEAFLVTDGVLRLCANVADGLVVNAAIIIRHIEEELPFMATEKMIMHAVKKGEDRQEMHELIRQHSMDAAKVVKQLGQDNDLIDRVVDDPEIPLDRAELQQLLDPNKMYGLCSQQVKRYVTFIRENYLDKMEVMVDKVVEV